ncbi:GGDEF domain-containing protein [Planomonospora sp. ID67723]|uniref:GGDEF domain-containing protein n=1 Tax=Planomonospora sp. ID67723 TaxID=2738134 RepID=UPI0018C378EF|nr:GGDEF domain-containing protein [Planomonospora sp. ID67723]MBG0831193.1 GGDEF domain-containing protein [Planomonospora sp. ID67723]
MDGLRARHVYPLGGVIALGVFMLLPDVIWRDALYVLIGLSSVVAAIWAAVRFGRVTGVVWALMGFGQLAAVLGDTLWLHYKHIALTDPFPSPADLFYLLEYPLVTTALVVLARHRRSPADREAVLDGAIFVVGLALPYWVLLIEPNIGGYDSAFEQTIALGYPLADMVLLAGLVRVLTVSGARTPAFRLLTAALVLLLVADVIFISTEGEEILGLPLGDLPFLMSYLVWGSAALHPSAADLLRTAPEAVPSFTTRRLLTLTAVVLLAPGTLAVQLLFGFELSAWAVTLTSALLFILVVARMAGLLRRMQDQAHRLDEIARTDMLTGLPNRRTLDAQIVREYERSAHTGMPLCLAMMDLDRFKLFNDTYGHQAGDRLLIGAATAWSLALTADDMLARYGGEEFVLLMPGRDLDAAEHLLSALRLVTPRRQTFSAGLALWDGAESPLELLHRADIALYEAKQNGRDRVARAGPSPSRPAPSAST